MITNKIKMSLKLLAYPIPRFKTDTIGTYTTCVEIRSIAGNMATGKVEATLIMHLLDKRNRLINYNEVNTITGVTGER